ncbi:MAG: hypothetical protein ABI983_04335 [Acidobacteriota bacterium]
MLTHAQEPSAADLMTRVGAYAAAYGEKTSVIVAAETYTQTVTVEGVTGSIRPIKLDAEFAIVKLQGGGWTGFRDVIEVNDEPVHDRKDRLMSLLTSESASISEATRIANESARFNVGPISRNFNTPTAALFFFLPENLERFTFAKKGTKDIDKIKTVEITFKETKLPTLVTTRSGKNVPLEGSLWVTEDGTVIRTRMHMEKFADADVAPDQAAPRLTGPTNVTGNGGGRPSANANVAGMDTHPIDSSADIEVTYRKPPGIDVWLPAQMAELYEGPIFLKNHPASGRASTRASYSNFKQFGAAGKIVPQ